MKEIEAKFAAIDTDELRAKLKASGFRLVYPERLMQRKMFSLDENRPGLYGRVRNEGNRITMTIKEVVGDTIDGMHEAEVEIDDFEQGVLFMIMSGWQEKAYQETRREMWHHDTDNVEVVIDTWPGIPTFCEIEGTHEQGVRAMASTLGFDWNQAFFGAVDVLYEHHIGMPRHVLNDATPVITFDNPPRWVA